MFVFLEFEGFEWFRVLRVYTAHSGNGDGKRFYASMPFPDCKGIEIRGLK